MLFYEPKTVALTPEQLQERLAYWQKVLRLQDWNIYARIVRGYEMENPNAMAHINVVYCNKSAIIRIMDPIDYEPDIVTPQDMEQSLVHELLHIHLWALNDDDTHNEMEQAIEAMSMALVQLERGKQREHLSANSRQGTADQSEPTGPE